MKNPCCPYETHCGRPALYGPWRRVGRAINRAIIPDGCSCWGEESYNPASPASHASAVAAGWVPGTEVVDPYEGVILGDGED